MTWKINPRSIEVNPADQRVAAAGNSPALQVSLNLRWMASLSANVGVIPNPIMLCVWHQTSAMSSLSCGIFGPRPIRPKSNHAIDRLFFVWSPLNSFVNGTNGWLGLLSASITSLSFTRIIFSQPEPILSFSASMEYPWPPSTINECLPVVVTVLVVLRKAAIIAISGFEMKRLRSFIHLSTSKALELRSRTTIPSSLLAIS